MGYGVEWCIDYNNTVKAIRTLGIGDNISGCARRTASHNSNPYYISGPNRMTGFDVYPPVFNPAYMRTFTAVLVACLLTALNAAGQPVPQWQWAKSDTAAAISINPSYPKYVVAANGTQSLWGMLVSKKM